MSDIANALRHELRDPEYSEGYAESFLNSYIATQIKVLREQRQLSQPQLGALIGTSQPGISRIENVNYSSWNIGTLKKLARAFNVRLKVSFEPYGTLPDDVESFSRASLQRPPREKDPGLADIGEFAIAPSEAVAFSNAAIGAYFGDSAPGVYVNLASPGASLMGFTSTAPLDYSLASTLTLVGQDQSKAAISPFTNVLQQGQEKAA